MGINETYWNRWVGWKDGIEPKGEIIFIMRSKDHVLSPSKDLLSDWRFREYNKMTWREYKRRFLKEMETKEAREEIARIAEMSKKKEIWLVCSCSNRKKECHRFIILELINKKFEKET